MRYLAALLAMSLLFGGSAEAAKKHSKRKPAHKRANMPKGWTWPPNKAMKAEGKQCLARLDELGVKWEKAKYTRKIATPIYVPAMELGGVKVSSIWRKGPHIMDCHLAVAMAESGGAALKALGITEVRFAGIYDYRRVRLNHRTKNVLSRHALGLAMDVYEFVTADGTKHIVKTDYKKGDQLLLDAEKAVNATQSFRMLLTPGNDPRSHWDHFHFEARTLGEKIETPPIVAVPAPASSAPNLPTSGTTSSVPTAP